MDECGKWTRRRVDGSNGRNTCLDDRRDDDGRELSSGLNHPKDTRCMYEMLKDGTYKDRNRYIVDRYSRPREEIGCGKRRQEDKHSEEHASGDYHSYKYDSEYMRDEISSEESYNKKLRTQNSNCDGSSINDDISARDKDYKVKRGSENKVGQSTKSQCLKQQHSDAERRFMSNGKAESVTNRRISYSCTDADSGTLSHNKGRITSNASLHVASNKYWYVLNYPPMVFINFWLVFFPFDTGYMQRYDLLNTILGTNTFLNTIWGAGTLTDVCFCLRVLCWAPSFGFR